MLSSDVERGDFIPQSLSRTRRKLVLDSLQPTEKWDHPLLASCSTTDGLIWCTAWLTLVFCSHLLMGWTDTIAYFFLPRDKRTSSLTPVFLSLPCTPSDGESWSHGSRELLKGKQHTSWQTPDPGWTGFKHDSSQKAGGANAFVVPCYLQSSEKKHQEEKKRKKCYSRTRRLT